MKQTRANRDTNAQCKRTFSFRPNSRLPTKPHDSTFYSVSVSLTASEQGQNVTAREKSPKHLCTEGFNKSSVGGLVVVSGGDWYRSVAEALIRKPFRLKKGEEDIGDWDVLTAAAHAFIRHHLSSWLIRLWSCIFRLFHTLSTFPTDFGSTDSVQNSSHFTLFKFRIPSVIIHWWNTA